MFRDNTILLLGAGASAPYDYPIGQGLISNIASGLVNLDTNLRSGVESASDVDVLNNPYRAAFKIAQWKKPGWIDSSFFKGGVRAWKGLGERLRHDPCPSIDEFARANPTQAGAIKLLIASEIASRTYDKSTLEKGGLVASTRITRNTRQNWYGKFLSQLRRHYRDESAFDPHNPFIVVTFNYDRSLEIFLEREMPQAELYRNVQWSDAVGVIHVHGEVDCVPDGQVMDGRAIEVHIAEGVLTSAERMLVVDDRRHSQDPAKVALHYLDRCDRIVTLGFDFHEQNVSLLSLENYGSKLWALNFAGTPGFDRRARRLSIPQGHIFSKSGIEYPITTAIDDGLFEG